MRINHIKTVAYLTLLTVTLTTENKAQTDDCMSWCQQTEQNCESACDRFGFQDPSRKDSCILDCTNDNYGICQLYCEKEKKQAEQNDKKQLDQKKAKSMNLKEEEKPSNKQGGSVILGE